MRTAIFAAIAGLGLLGGMATANAAPPYYSHPYYGGGAYARPVAGRVCPHEYYWARRHYDRWGRLWQTGCVPQGF